MIGPNDWRALKAEIAWWKKSWGISCYLSRDYAILLRSTRRGFPIAVERVIIADLDALEAWAVLSGAVYQMAKRKGEAGKEHAQKVLHDELTSTRYPELWWRLTATAWPDGQPRVTDTLTISAEDGLLRAKLRDRDEGWMMWTSDRSLMGLLESVEVRAVEDKDWVEDKYYEPKKPRVRKSRK